MIPATQAVEALINEYGKLVFQTIYGLTGDWEESQDLTQDTFHQALKSIDAARAKSGLQFHAKAWLLQIALNTVRMQRRRRSIFRFIPFSKLQEEEVSASETSSQQTDIEVLNESAAPVQPPGYGAIESIDLETFVAEKDAIRRSLAHIPEPLRVCLLLSVIGQFSTREIAQMLDVEEATVRQRLGRARKQFQSFYEHESGEEIVDNSEATKNAKNMSQKRPPNHHSNIERAELRFPG